VTVAASDERSRLLELFEAQNDEGPCRDRYRLGTAVVNIDLDGAPERWPRFAPQAIAGGFRSANALRLAQALADAATIGILPPGPAIACCQTSPAILPAGQLT
jgi:hypothetical protein